MTTRARATTALWPPWLRGPWGLAALAAGAYVLVYIGWTAFGWGGEAWRSLISNTAFLPMSLFASLAAARVVFQSGLERAHRRAWTLLALAVAAYFAGDLLFLYYENVLRLPEAGLTVTLADGFYLLFYPLALAGLVALPGAPLRGGERLRFAFDLGIVLVTAWMAVWYFVISPTAQQTQPDLFSQLVSAAYPIGDLVVLAGLFVLLYRGQEAATRSTLILLSGALLNFVASDLAYATTRLSGVYQAGGWVDVGWIVAYLFFALAALRQPFLERGSITERLSAGLLRRLSIALPLVALGVGYGLVLAIEVTRVAANERVLGLFASAALLTAFVAARQGLALADNLRLNAELTALSADLEQRVQERTRQLEQAQAEVLQSQKLAIVGTLAAEVVHEVSNPLNLVINAGETLETQLEETGAVDRETLAEFLPIINRAAWHATRILQTLRSFSRGYTPELLPQRVDEVVRDTLRLMAGQVARWPGVRLVTDVPADLPPVVCDRNQIAQVLINLINNAHDALPDGGTITVRARLVDLSVALEVSDDGVGLAPELLDQIFKPFFTTKPIGQGSGLGLSIVERIVREHGGAVTASSVGPGHGVTITVTLPQAAPPGGQP